MLLGTNQTLIHGDCIYAIEKEIAPDSVDLVVADPPYFKVVGEKWDYQWRTEADYLDWSRRWIERVVKSMRYGATMYLFGYFRTLALMVPMLRDVGLSLRQQIVVDKGIKAIAGHATKNYRMFPCTTESILFLVKDNIPFSRNLLKSRQMELGLTSREINEALGVKSNGGGMWSIYTGKNVCEQFPTRKIWDRLQEVLGFDLPYDRIAQTFNPQPGFTDVWRDIDFYSESRIHPTQKPLKLVERLILASSNEGDLVLDPFSGSGSTLTACERLGRRCIAIEMDEGYIQKTVDRFNVEQQQT